MSYVSEIIDYLYFNKNLDDEEIIEIGKGIVNECLNHMKVNE